MHLRNFLLLFLCNLTLVLANDLTNTSALVLHHRNRRAAIQEPIKLINNPLCPEIKHFCTELSANADDLQTLGCVQSFLKSQVEQLSADCQHTIWKSTSDLLEDASVYRIVQKECVSDEGSCVVKSESGQYLSCMLDRLDDIKSANCHAQITRLELVAFIDFRLIGTFLRDCEDDINVHACGRLSVDHGASQWETLSCLQNFIEDLKKECRKGVLKLSEYQGDNVKLDRQLFIACTNDARRLCPELRAGTGAVYKCLIRNKNDKLMSTQCQAQLLRRDKLIAHDYKVSKGLARSCKEDIKVNHCRRGVSEDKDVRLAQILLCLETAYKNNTKITPDCLAEMNDHRKLLMEEYQLSPEILTGCADDIQKFCENIESGSKTIHCLMEHARPKKKKDRRVTSTCQRALEQLVKVSDVAEDWRVDPVLRDACKPVVDVACRDAKSGDARVMSCLMEKLGTNFMRPDCEIALMQIQYFVARDFKLDPQLYR